MLNYINMYSSKKITNNEIDFKVIKPQYSNKTQQDCKGA